MSAPSLTDTLSLGYSGLAAERARASYRGLLGAVLIVEAAAGIALLVAPLSVAGLLGLDATGAVPLVRLTGLLILVIAALLFTGRGWPARTKLINMVAVIGRALVALLLLLSGGRLIWVGLAELVAAIALGLSYYSYFKAEVMSRP